MYGLLIFILGIVVYLAAYFSFTSLIPVPSRESEKLLDKINKKQGQKKGYTDRLLEPVIRYVSKFIAIETYRREKLARNLQKVGMKDTSPEEYYARTLVLCGISALSAIMLIVLGMPALSFVSIGLIPAIYYNENTRVTNKLKKMNEKILEELPQFVSTVEHSMSGEADMVKIIEKYRVIAGEAFKYDLDMLIAELKNVNVNEEEALKRFDARINIPDLSMFVNGLIGLSKGIDQGTFFFYMRQSMKKLSQENTRRKLQKMPGKIKIAMWLVGSCLVLMSMTSMYYTFVAGTKIFE